MLVDLISLLAATEAEGAQEAVTTAVESAAPHAEEAAGIAALGIDPLAILAQAFTFLLLFWLIKKFALGKIVATLEERRKTIDAGVRLGQEMTEEKERLDAEVEKVLHAARLEADKVIAAGQQEAGGLIKEAEVAATQKVETMLKDAEARIEQEIERARKGLEQEMAALVADATEKIIGEKLDVKKDASLIERALKGVRA